MITLKEAQELVRKRELLYHTQLCEEVERDYPDLVKYINKQIKDAIYDVPQRDNITVVWYFSTISREQMVLEYIKLHGFSATFLAQKDVMTRILIDWRY